MICSCVLYNTYHIIQLYKFPLFLQRKGENLKNLPYHLLLDPQSTVLLSTIENNALFNGIDTSELDQLFQCLYMKVEVYDKQEVILLTGDTITHIGMILSGGARVLRYDINGNQSIVTELGRSDLFAEVFVCAGVKQSPVTIETIEPTKILRIDFASIIKPCNKTCGYHNKLVENMLGIIAGKTLQMNQRIDILSKRSTREKILCYLEGFQIIGREFQIPYNREELARYLCVDRSALSIELSKMQKEGMLEYHKSRFTLYE